VAVVKVMELLLAEKLQRRERGAPDACVNARAAEERRK
jgi:hypothetical protein